MNYILKSCTAFRLISFGLYYFDIQNLFEGVTGVVTQPVRGSQLYCECVWLCIMYLNVWIFALGLQKEGAVGLLKGTGKGLVGLLVRPTGGLVDLASGTLSFVSRYRKWLITIGDVQFRILGKGDCTFVYASIAFWLMMLFTSICQS